MSPLHEHLFPFSPCVADTSPPVRPVTGPAPSSTETPVSEVVSPSPIAEEHLAGEVAVDPATGRPAGRAQALVLLLSSCLAVLGGVLLAPVLPAIQDAFAGSAGVEALTPIVDRLGRNRLLVRALVVYAFVGTAPLWLPSDAIIGLTSALAIVGILGVVAAVGVRLARPEAATEVPAVAH